MNLVQILEKGLGNYNLVDVRSESEYQHDHIPESVNIPLLNDAERTEVGIIYKNKGPKTARLKGVDIISPKLPSFINSFMDIDNKKPLIVYCWRGGLRSEAAVNFLKLAGIDKVFKLKGGYKAFRREINDFFSSKLNCRFVTVYGPTGCAKTELIKHFSGKNSAVDLEKHACHKGSVFGDIGEKYYRFVTQKNFETGIWYDIYKSGNNKYLFAEGESRKIGKVVIPQRLFKEMNYGISVCAETPLEFRVCHTIKEYPPEQYKEAIEKSLMKIKRYLGSKKTSHLKDLLNNGEYYEFTRILLTEYYDPMYYKSIPSCPDYKICYSSVEEGIEKLENIYEETVSL